MTLTGPDGAADRADRSHITELVLSEAERMQCGDLGLRMVLSAGKSECALSQCGGAGRVRLDQLEGGLRQLQRVVPTDRDSHASRCIRTVTTCSQCS